MLSSHNSEDTITLLHYFSFVNTPTYRKTIHMHCNATENITILDDKVLEASCLLTNLYLVPRYTV